MTLYPGSLQIPAMRYHNKLKDEVVDKAMHGNGWVAQEKIDGNWYMLERTDDGIIYLFSRSKSKKTGELTEKIDNVPHIKEWAECLPFGTVLIGEIYVQGGKANNATKIMGALKDKALQRQFETDEFGGPIHYMVFDCIRYAGEDLTNKSFKERYTHLQKISFDNDYINRSETYSIDDSEIWTSVDSDTFWPLLDTIFENGGEGMVLKKEDSIYEPDKRPCTCFKLKEHVDTLDFVIMDLLDPEYYYDGKEASSWVYKDEDGKLITKAAYYGWKNAISLGAYNKDGKLVRIGKVASGLTDKLRQDMAENPDNYIGNVVEVSCMSIDKKEMTLRHPVFIRVRQDKNPQECIIEEIFN